MRNTTLAVVVASVPLSRVALQQVAQAATAALHRRITPAGTTFDGDVVFALSPLGVNGVGTGAYGDGAHSAGAPPSEEVDSPRALDHHPFDARRGESSPSALMQLMQVEALAAAALEHAIERAVRLARGRDGVPGLGDDAEAGEQQREAGGEDGGRKRRAQRHDRH
jgi:L-aminopeptidase/D-esterase-like protein